MIINERETKKIVSWKMSFKDAEVKENQLRNAWREMCQESKNGKLFAWLWSN
jgi:hypothetical protein